MKCFFNSRDYLAAVIANIRVLRTSVYTRNIGETKPSVFVYTASDEHGGTYATVHVT